MQVKIYSPENFISEFTKNFIENTIKNTDKIIKKPFKSSVKNLIKLQNGKYFEIKETEFDPHGPEGDWDEFTEKNRKAYKEAMKNYEKGDTISFEELQKKYS